MSAVTALRNAIVFRSFPAGSRVRMLGRGDLFVNSADNRGRSVLRSCGVTQPIPRLFWKRLMERVDPTVVLDIGANYGEFGLSLNYAPQTRVFLFEANPHLVPYLRQSIASHVNASNINLVTSLVSDAIGTSPFFVDLKWSGTSSAIGKIVDEDGVFKGAGKESFEQIDVAMITIDSMFADWPALQGERLLFKIDVEGYEGHVWSGMCDTLRRLGAFAGIVEFDTDYLSRAGSDPADLFQKIASCAHIFTMVDGTLTSLLKLPPSPVHMDILLASSSDLVSNLRLPRSVQALF